ncbi:MAG: hypothetical protein V5A62_09315 [Haloarculaceae archaeon]
MRSFTPDRMVADLNGYTLWFGEKLPEAGAEGIGRRYRTYPTTSRTTAPDGHRDGSSTSRPSGGG